MKNRYIYLFLLFLFMIQPGYSQQRPSSGGQAIPAVSFFVSGDYFSPGFGELNSVFQTIERNYLLPPGRDFKDYYNVLLGIRFTPVPQQSVQIEFGGSIYKSRSNGLLGQDRSTSSIQMSYVGGTYLLNFPMAMVPVNFFVGGGLGYVWLNAQRSYSVQPGIAKVNAGLTQLHALGGAEYVDPTGVTFTVDAGYSFATTLFPRRADANFTIKGITGGIKIGVPLIKIL